MTVEELVVFGKENIHSIHAKILLADLLGINQLDLINHLNEEVDKNIEKIYKRRVEMLHENKPIQYIMENVNFYGKRFYINENVLIPRFETEELVENTLQLLEENFKDENLNIIDLGCGSGVIGLTLKSKLPHSNVTLVDISEDALKIAKKNSKDLKIKAKFINNDFLDGIDKKFNCIISNPPYIKTTEEIEEIVKNNEPHLALYAGEDGLDCYRKIFKNIKNNLEEQYLIALEIGMTQKDDVIKIINESLDDNHIVIAKKDMQGRDRMIFVIKNNE
ncbi:MAG: peptide chain release factor N(5)-glutamine methyltransferase [Bacilli bacterium]|nr:peptide chain release factor N(5)-glutamine methyltransferase [Bacilli bacterium]